MIDFALTSRWLQVFVAGLPPHVRALTGNAAPPSAAWIGMDWFGKLFGHPGSAYGHTTLTPHETDKCGTCCQLKIDMRSTQKSVERHGQQGDQGDAGRMHSIIVCNDMLQTLQEELKDHRAKCADAEHDYKVSKVDAHAKYCAAVAVLRSAVAAWATGQDSKAEEEALIASSCELSTVLFIVVDCAVRCCCCFCCWWWWWWWWWWYCCCATAATAATVLLGLG